MKERFKTHFGSTYEDFFDGDKTIIMDEESYQKSKQEPSEASNQPQEPEKHTNSRETEFQFHTTSFDSDDMLLNQLIQANNEIDKLK